MIELRRDQLVVRRHDVHPEAEMTIDFQRTLRIPDDGREHPLPAGLGSFPLVHVDDFAERVPRAWVDKGGVMLPMYQSEALWLDFGAGYPFAVKVASGKIDAVTGQGWADGLRGDPQDYMVLPPQPWLDGWCVEAGVIRQFVAAPLGSGHTVEAQLTGEEQIGGIQIVIYPMKRERAERWLAAQRRRFHRVSDDVGMTCCASVESYGMGLGAGGRMRQEIYADEFGLDAWDQSRPSRCFVHLVNSMGWREITGREAPPTPITEEEYRRHHVPWFAYYDADAKALPGGLALAGIRSVQELAARRPGQVREASF
jgi:hypothetical protein